MDRNQAITTYRRNPIKKALFPERSVRVNDGEKRKMLTIVIFLTCGHMLLQSAAIAAKKLPVNDKMTACVKEIYLLDVVCKVRKKNILLS